MQEYLKDAEMNEKDYNSPMYVTDDYTNATNYFVLPLRACKAVAETIFDIFINVAIVCQV